MPNLTKFELVMFMSCDGHNLEGCKLVQEQDILETPCGVYICMNLRFLGDYLQTAQTWANAGVVLL